MTEHKIKYEQSVTDEWQWKATCSCGGWLRCGTSKDVLIHAAAHLEQNEWKEVTPEQLKAG
jgi:hypothetical protein